MVAWRRRRGPLGDGRPSRGRGAPVRHGPAAPGPARAWPRAGDAVVRWSTSGRLARGARRAPRPPPPFQVPSASRRGGLKTPGGGSPVRLGVGAVGPAGSREVPPGSPWLRRPPRGRGGARGVARHGHCRRGRWGRGLPGGRRVGRGRVRRVRALPPRPRGRAGTPRAPVGFVRARPAWRVGAGRPRCVKPFPTPSGLLFSRLTWPARGNPLPPASPPPRGREGGVGMCRARGGSPAETKRSRKARTTLSGGSLGSCVDEERS